MDPALRAELQGRLEAGEFWVDEAEFVSQFDDVTVGYPITEEGHLKSIFTGTLVLFRQTKPSGPAVGRVACVCVPIWIRRCQTMLIMAYYILPTHHTRTHVRTHAHTHTHTHS